MVIKKFVYIIVLFAMFGCSEYQRVLKSTDLELKFKKAVEYYEDEKYNKAYVLFDELMTLYSNTRKAQEVYFYYAMTNYHLKDYILASYHFKNFSQTFSNHEHAEEAAFMVGYCYYLESPAYSLDQTYTYKAMNELQLFVNTHPESLKLQECNNLIRDLRKKLERKSFEKAKQYFFTQYYQSAVVAFNNTLNDFPDTQYREEAMYFRLRSAYELAKNSIEEKKLQRFIESKTAYSDFIGSYPESDFAKAAGKMFEEIELEIKNLENQS